MGKGDLLYHPMGVSKPIRVQGTYVSDDEIKKVISFIKNKNSIDSHEEMETVQKQINAVSENKKQDYDEYLKKAAELVVHEGQASVSYIQRKLKVGYARAARIVDQMEEIGIVGDHQGSKPRNVLINIEELEELNL